MTAEPQDVEQELADEIVKYEHDPAGFARFAYPWEEGELADSKGPRPWQAEVLDYIGSHLREPSRRFQPCTVAVCSGHGIGKSALISMISNWALSTSVDCRIKITANTFTQLDTTTAPEVSKWFRRGINEHWFNIAATSIKAKDPEHERNWRLDFTPWSEKNPQATAGLHNKGKRILYIFDEASEIPDVIWETVSGSMSDEDTEIIWLAFGNPTPKYYPNGRFFRCFGDLAHRWKTWRIDSRTVEGTNKDEIQKDIDDWGEDSDFVRVRWRGEFPRIGANQFISSEAVAACRKYQAEGYEQLPKIISCDVARQGSDQTVIAFRQGRKSRILAKLRGLDNVQVARRLIEHIEAEDAQAVVVDADGLGTGVVDYLNNTGYSRFVHEFHGGTKADNSNAYYNRRAEVWGLMREMIHAGMELPNDSELCDQLCALQYGYSNKNQIQLERKEDLKKRLPSLGSPDCADAMAMSFAVRIAPKLPEKEEPLTWVEGEASLQWMG